MSGNNRVALITGASGGFGSVVTALFLDAGSRVSAVALERETPPPQSESCISTLADLTVRSAAESAVRQTIELFPASVSPHSSQPLPVKGDLSGSGTVLIVDDEELVRQTAKYTLERYGCTAMAAADGAGGVDVCRRQPDAVGLVLLDLTMPVMSGEEALRELQLINPNVRVLLTSGYNEVEAVQRFAGKGLAGFIQKPYTAAALAEKVKEVLTDRSRGR